MLFDTRSCAPEFREFFNSKYNLDKDQPLARFIWQNLFFTSNWSKWQAFICAYGRNPKEGELDDFRANKFLNKCWKKLDQEGELGPLFKNGKTALQTNIVWPDEAFKLAEAERNLDNYESRIYWASGLNYGRAERNYVPIIRTPVGEKIINYLNRVSGRTFIFSDDRYVQARNQIRATRPDDNTLFSSQKNLLNIIKAIYDDKKPVYSQAVRSDRVFGESQTLQSLSGDLRAILYPKWIELDLKNAQLAILTSILNLPITKAALKQRDYSLWADLEEHMRGIDFKTSQGWQDLIIKNLNCQQAPVNYTFTIKSILKAALYPLCFGASKGSISRHLNYHIGPGAAEIWWAHPVIHEVLLARDAYIEIQGDNGGSALACAAHSIELEIIYEIYKISETTTNWQITLHSHDGISIALTHKSYLNSTIKACKKVVSEKCAAMDIPTSLEWKKTDNVYHKKVDFLEGLFVGRF